MIKSYKDIPYTTDISKCFISNSDKNPFQYFTNNVSRDIVRRKFSELDYRPGVDFYCEYDDGLVISLVSETNVLSISFDGGYTWTVDVLRGMFVIGVKRFGKESFFVEYLGLGTTVIVAKTTNLFKTLTTLYTSDNVLDLRNSSNSQLSNIYVSNYGYVVSPSGYEAYLGQTSQIRSVDLSEARSIIVFKSANNPNIVKVVDTNDYDIVHQFNIPINTLNNMSVTYYKSKGIVLIYDSSSYNTESVLWFNIHTRTFGLLNADIMNINDPVVIKYELLYINDKLFTYHIQDDSDKLFYREIQMDDTGDIIFNTTVGYSIDFYGISEHLLKDVGTAKYYDHYKYFKNYWESSNNCKFLQFGNHVMVVGPRSTIKLFIDSGSQNITYRPIRNGYRYKNTITVTDYIDMNVNSTCFTLNAKISTVLSGDDLQEKSEIHDYDPNNPRYHFVKNLVIQGMKEELDSSTCYFYNSERDLETFVMNFQYNGKPSLRILTTNIAGGIFSDIIIDKLLNPSSYFELGSRKYIISFEDISFIVNDTNKLSYTHIYDVTNKNQVFKVATIPLENRFDELSLIAKSKNGADLPYNKSKRLEAVVIGNVVYVNSDNGVHMYNESMKSMGKLHIPNIKGIITKVEYLNGSYFITTRRSDIRKSVGVRSKDVSSNMMIDDYIYYGKDFNSLIKMDLDSKYVTDIKCDPFRNKLYVVYTSYKLSIYDFDGTNLVKFRDMLRESYRNSSYNGLFLPEPYEIIHKVSVPSASAINSFIGRISGEHHYTLPILTAKLDVGDYILYLLKTSDAWVLFKESKDGYFEILKNDIIGFRYINMDNRVANVILDLVDCGSNGKFIVAMSDYYTECINLVPSRILNEYTNDKFNISQKPKVTVISKNSYPYLIYKNTFDMKITRLSGDSSTDIFELYTPSHYDLDEIIFPKSPVLWVGKSYCIPYLDRILVFNDFESINGSISQLTINKVFGYSVEVLTSIMVSQLINFNGNIYGSFYIVDGVTRRNFTGVLKRFNDVSFDVYIIQETIRESSNYDGPYNHFLDIINDSLCVCDSNNNKFIISHLTDNSVADTNFKMFCDSDTISNSDGKVVSFVGDDSSIVYIRNFYNDVILKVDSDSKYAVIIDEATGRKCVEILSSTPTEMERISIGDYDITYSTSFSESMTRLIGDSEFADYTHLYD